ncbi:MAG: hypothetical protein E7135_03340 [Rikenellaceae bacterium]|nr:hypothetical protein [Rikenellaceae bacterium]
MKKRSIILVVVQVLLLVAIGGLLYWIFSMTEENISAEKQINDRETAVIEHSKKLKDLVEMYFDANKQYPSNWDELIAFAKDGYVTEPKQVYDPNNLGKFEPKEGYVDEVWGEFSKDTIWYEASYHLLALRAKKDNPNWSNDYIDTVYARKAIYPKLTDAEIEELRYIPYSNKVEFQIATVKTPTQMKVMVYDEKQKKEVEETVDTMINGRFRCHAPYVSFLDTKEYSQQFWNFIDDKFNYYVKNADGNKEMLKQMAADGSYKALTSTETRNGETKPKYYSGTTPETRIYMDIEFFGVTFGNLEKASLDGSWEDQRTKN